MIFYVDPVQNDPIVMSQCMHFIFCQGREVKLSEKSVQPVTEKERKGKGKWTIGPRKKNGCANLCSFFVSRTLLSVSFASLPQQK